MIKKIHYCWFGHNKLSDLNIKCINSWKKALPDWEIIEWNENNINLDSVPLFAKKAYEYKMWAFVADYVRMKVLYEQGGLYLDVDMEIIKSPAKLFKNNFVTGFESKKCLSCGLMYSEPKSFAAKKILEYYDSAVFDKRRFITLPVIMTDILFDNKLIEKNGKYQNNKHIAVYPREYFYPFNPYLMIGQSGITANTYANHHFDGSWLKKESIFIKINKRINNFFAKKKI